MKSKRIEIPGVLREAISDLELAGCRLSNIAFNLSQHGGKVLSIADVQAMRRCYQEFDKTTLKLAKILRKALVR